VAFVRAANEVGLSPNMMGGTLIGLLATPLKVLMGPLMNGYVKQCRSLYASTDDDELSGVPVFTACRLARDRRNARSRCRLGFSP
jgi:hypothetical protein